MSVVAEKIREHYITDHINHTEDKKLFLEGFRQRGVVQGGLDLAGICRATAYSWRSLDPEFRRAWDEVKETCNDNVRQTIYEQALTGKNALYSIFYAKHNCPEYRERVQVDVTMIHSEIENRLEQLQAKFTGVAEMVTPQEMPQEVPPQLPPQSTKEIIAEVFGLSPERVPEPRD